MQVVSLTLPDDADPRLRRQHLFLTMALRHLQFFQLTRELPEPVLEAMLRSEFFMNEGARRHLGSRSGTLGRRHRQRAGEDIRRHCGARVDFVGRGDMSGMACWRPLQVTMPGLTIR